MKVLAAGRSVNKKLAQVPNKRVLITGAAGFLGSHLCDRFIKEGFDVVMDNHYRRPQKYRTPVQIESIRILSP